MIIKFKIGFEPHIGFLYVLKITQVDLFILHRWSEPFDKDVVEHPAAPIHADLDVLRQQDIGEARGRELTALITIENLTLGVL